MTRDRGLHRPTANSVRAIAAGLALALVAVATVSAASTAASAQLVLKCAGATVTVDLRAGQLPTAGDDVIYGTDGPDLIAASDGNDIVCARGGDDTVWGQNGNDIIFGGDGNDKLRGGDGDDRLHGEDGVDDLNGGRDNDHVYGQAGNDAKVRGGTGDDVVSGGPGADALVAGNGGSDHVSGGDGDDPLVTGGPRPDTVSGGDGNDFLRGNKGADIMLGGFGDDDVRGGEQPDVVDGGPGTDSCNGGTQSDQAIDCETTTNTETTTTRSGIERLEAEWALDRADIVTEIMSAGSGIGADNVLRGPGDFEIDLNSCPAGWDNSAGVSGGVIELAHTTALSGGLSAFGDLQAGMAVYFDRVNATGGIGADNLQIDFIVRDDGYVATNTQGLVDDLIENERPIAISTLGTPQTFAVRDRLNDSCVPQVFSQTGHHAFGDPQGHPWTTGSQFNYASEARLWVEWIEENLADDGPVTVAAIVMDNDFGRGYEEAFDEHAINSDVIDGWSIVFHDPAAANLDGDMGTLAAAQADVFIAMTAGNPCLLTIQAAAATGITDTARAMFLPSVCASVPAYIAPAGAAADGWMIMAGGQKVVDASSISTDPWLGETAGLLGAAGIDAASASLHVTGAGFYGWNHVQALRIAAELPGGLTRTNLMLAVRSFDFNHPFVVDGIAYEMDGNNDAHLLEGSQFQTWDFETQRWTVTGVLDINGETPACTWDPGNGCR